MQTVVIDIHPLDLGDLLEKDNSNDGPEIMIHREPLVEYDGKFYRQTVDVPVTSESGKAILEQIKTARIGEETITVK